MPFPISRFYNYIAVNFKAFMKILLRQVLITDAESPYNQTHQDILIINGVVDSIQKKINVEAEQVIDAKSFCISPGWVDCFVHVPDPGQEFKETIESIAAVAVAGGYTDIFSLPNTNPVIENKGSVEYIIKRSASLAVSIIPLGAISKNIAGKELAEMYDMNASGAIAFSDGLQPVQSAGLLLKALQYVRSFNGTIIQLPVDKTIAPNGLANEGIISTQLGLPGIPAIAEELMIHRDLELLEYTNSKLHLTGVTTAKGIELVVAAKKKGLNITCSVTPFHLLFCDEDLHTYDTNLKQSPPLRTRKDMLALREAVLNGNIDAIASHHQPHDLDNKQAEFEYAKPGMISLQTTFNMLLTALPNIKAERIVELLSTNMRKALNLPVVNVKEGAVANFTLFDLKDTTTLTTEKNKSRSANSPFFGQKMNGKVIGIISKGQLYLN
jgi:dihydroorotase